MVFDVIENAARYEVLNKGFKAAFDFLRRPDLKELAPGEYELVGRKVYASISKMQGREAAAAKIETHQRYIDIQMVLGGTDTMGWAPAASCQSSDDGYDAERDLQFFNERPQTWLVVEDGSFAVFFPEDAHLPLIGEGMIHKVVVKVAVAQD